MTEDYYSDEYEYEAFGCSEDHYDYEEEAFYALTDGMYGDYEYWKEGGGDISSLKDCLGF